MVSKNNAYDALLRLRRRREAAAVQAFHRAQQAADDCRRTADELRGAAAGHEAVAREAVFAGRPYPAVQRACLAELARARAAEAPRRANADTRCERARGELLEAMRQRKALSCLKERQERLAQLAVARREADEADDRYAAHRAFAPGAS